MDPHRNERVSESLREELEELINYELSDPRVGPATITEVHLSPDFRHANGESGAFRHAGRASRHVAALEHAKQFLRHQLAERLQLYKTPELQF